MYTVYTVLLDTFSPAVRVNNMGGGGGGGGWGGGMYGVLLLIIGSKLFL